MKTKAVKNITWTSAAIAIFAFGFSSAFAAQGPADENVTVLEQPISNQKVESVQFAVDRELGRAWIDVELVSTSEADRGPEWSPPVVNVVHRNLAGLRYDRDRKQVLYGDGPSAVVCAEDAPTGTALKTTGECELKVSSEMRRIDDGFAQQEQLVSRVVFQVESSSSRATAVRP